MDRIYARHGDLVFREEPIPEGVVLNKLTAPLVLAGNESAPHTIADFKSVEHVVDGDVQRLRVLATVELSHGGRHTTISIAPGEYVVYPLAEMSGSIARRVED